MDTEIKTLITLLNSNSSKKLMKSEYLRIAKNSDLADNIRQKGNTIFTRFDHDTETHEQAWKFYSISIATAEPNTEALAMAYGNRSAVLIHLLKYEPCMADIDRAVEITTNDGLKIKLLCRKVKCLIALGCQEEGENIITTAQELLERIEDETVKKSFKNLIKKTKLELKKPSNIEPTLKDKKTRMIETLFKEHNVNDFSAVDIQYNQKFGRHLVATRDIPPGKVIFIEKPYTKFLNTKKLHAYCSHCFTTTWANIPCDNCSWTMFCSEKCKKEAWEEYHEIECPVYACTKRDVRDVGAQLGIRTMILGIKEAGGVENLKAELQAFDESNDFKKGFVKNGVIQPDGFKSIYALSNEISLNEVPKYAESTAWVLRSLARNTTFFGENFNDQDSKSYKRNENAVFLGSLFLRLKKISELNHHEMWNGNYVCKNGLDRLACWTNECCSRGVYIAPITGLLNHSCDPNARRCYSNNHHVIIYAIQTIKKGDQIFDCYQQEFYELDTMPRQKLLRKFYNFTCDCIACQNGWPHLMKIFEKSRCNGLDAMDATEIMLALEYRNLVPSTLDPNAEYDEETIAHLGRGIEKSYKLTQPAFTTVNLIICINTIFERLYGIWLDIPNKCPSA